LADSDEGLARHVIALCMNPDKMSKQILCAEKTARLRFGPEAVDFAVGEGPPLAGD